MSAFFPIPPSKAVEFVEAAGINDGQRIIADYAAAGLLKSYAQVIETIELTGVRAEVRGGSVPVELWQRIICEGAAEDVWPGGTVRLAGAELRGGAPAVNITGIGFAEKHLQRLVDHHRVSVKKRPPKAARAEDRSEEAPPAQPAPVGSKKPAPEPIPPGAILATINQAKAALSVKQTKLYELINTGQLERRYIGKMPRITVASIRAYESDCLATLPTAD